MSNKLLIYIDETQCFDLATTIQTISAIEGTSNASQGDFIGALFECNYSYAGRETIVRISEDLRTIVMEGIGAESAEFAVKFQQCTTIPLHVIDMNYDFDLELSEFQTGQELIIAMNEAD